MLKPNFKALIISLGYTPLSLDNRSYIFDSILFFVLNFEISSRISLLVFVVIFISKISNY